MTYGLQAPPHEKVRADQVWQVVFDAYNKGTPAMSLDDIVSAANIAPHLPLSSRRTYARNAIHWVRNDLQEAQKMALVCDRSTGLYWLTSDPTECHEYYKGVNSQVLTSMRSAVKCLVGNTKPIKEARKSARRLIEDLEDAVS